MRELPDSWSNKTLLEVVGDKNESIVGGPFGSNLKVSDYLDQGVPILRLQNIGWRRFINKDIRFISEDKAKELNYHSFKPGDLALAKLGDPIGKTCIIPESIGGGIVVSDVVRIRNESPNVDTRYLMHVLNSPISINQLNKQVFGTTRPRINLEQVRNLIIPIPPLDTQRKIVAILDKAEETRRLRAQANELTQTLLQSVFLEMFGDPVENPKGWNTETLGNLVTGKKSISCGPFGSQLKIGEYVDWGVPVLGIDNVEKDRFVWAKPKHVTEEKAEQLKEFITGPGDVLITRTGTVGRACIVPESVNGAIIGPNLLKIRFDQTKLTPEFFSASLNYMPSMMEQVVRLSPGATVAVLNTTNLRALKIVVPPIDLQREFARLTNEIKSMNASQEVSENTSSSLFNVLMQKAFTGELVA